MSGVKGITGALIGVYGMVARSDVFRTAPGQAVFSRAYFAYKRYWEDLLFGLARRRPHLFRGGHALDVGANIGYTAGVLAAAIDQQSRVYAFEPEPRSFELLVKYSSGRSDGKIVPVRTAVGAECGEVALWLNKQHHADHRIATEAFRHSGAEGPSVSVPITSLDAFVESNKVDGPIRFVKIDVQGFEPAICRGMEKIAAANPGLVMTVEFTPESIQELGFRPEDLTAWLAARGFRIHTIHRGGELTDGVDSGALQRRGYLDLLALRSEP